MTRFLAVFIGTEAAREKAGWNALSDAQRNAIWDEGVKAWKQWIAANAAAIVEMGAPLGKTKRVSRQGIEDFQNSLTAYLVVEAESHDAAAMLFVGHPHFTVFAGDSVEIMECLPIPSG